MWICVEKCQRLLCDSRVFSVITCRVNFIHAGELLRVGLSTLPGCKIKDSKRSVSADLKTLKDSGVTDLFVFSTEAELAT